LVETKIDFKEDPSLIEELRNEDLKPITYEKGVAKTNRIDVIKYLECSAISNKGLNEIFENV
jgi:GTPase SAR1 family protein